LRSARPSTWTVRIENVSDEEECLDELIQSVSVDKEWLVVGCKAFWVVGVSLIAMVVVVVCCKNIKITADGIPESASSSSDQQAKEKNQLLRMQAVPKTTVREKKIEKTRDPRGARQRRIYQVLLAAGLQV